MQTDSRQVVITVRTSLETHYFSATHITPLTPQLYSRGRFDPVPDPLLLRTGSAGNRTRTSGSVAIFFYSIYIIKIHTAYKYNLTN
jgi:hypothetical protein